MPELRTKMAPQAAQALAQALTAWALLLLWVQSSEGLVAWTLFLVVVTVLPFRAGASDKKRAIANFASGAILLTLIFWGLIDVLIDFAFSGGRDLPLSTTQTLLLVATVLFMFSGAFYWLRGRRTEGAWV